MKKEDERLNLPKGESLLTPEEIGTYFMVENPESIIAIVDIGQPRISSTARAIVASSGLGFDEVHFQPWKYIQRYAKPLSNLGYDPSVTISGGVKKERLILLKETPGGPNDPRENFDPVGILIAKGVPVNQIRVMLGIREPFAQFASWYKFDNSRRPEIFLVGQEFIFSLLEEYRKQGILVVPFIFELFYPNPEEYLKWLYQQLEIADCVSLPQNLAFSENPSVIWHEADPRLDSLSLDADVGSKYFERVVAPVLQQGKFQIPQPRFFFPENPDSCLIEAFKNYREKATSFYQESVKRGLPTNKEFEMFITELNNY